MLRVEYQCYHVMSRCSGVCMSITTQIFSSCDLPVSPRSSQFELRSNCGLGCLVRPPGKALEGPQAQQTLVWTPWCVPSMDMSYSPALAVLHWIGSLPKHESHFVRERRTAKCSAIREISIDEIRTR